MRGELYRLCEAKVLHIHPLRTLGESSSLPFPFMLPLLLFGIHLLNHARPEREEGTLDKSWLKQLLFPAFRSEFIVRFIILWIHSTRLSGFCVGLFIRHSASSQRAPNTHLTQSHRSPDCCWTVRWWRFWGDSIQSLEALLGWLYVRNS